ncbi:MAG TPA: prepilin-type N-terminal cleavage/methylation domain-containing protein [Miltoncostaeaceae bacterium]|nr:prepilin-type N-terminal cleavage/methylation domain-containing protein [Miltoncostaeaceae bacterium]
MKRSLAGSRTAQQGVTFVEVLMVTVIVGLLAAVLIPAVLGQQEKAQGGAAQSLLRTGASAVESASVDVGYIAITPATLHAVEPNIAWQAGAGATTGANAVSVSALSDAGYTLTTTTPSGQTFVLVKDANSIPTITRTCGPGCTW